ncbi:unnamed protein product [Spirodela intermedia]|uniref:Uncharacterized protein n=1 Tax=Spirodela intermedia TaxID=51605 RepID=A0A7I8IH03_SPIIN|nr:unnamed protein product [Spirodela intermedia]CAA6657171.1 unnamed protein product [Spirodela intermedia]CAA6675736.1 unnamed protein product [Spirodela intermedia]
MQRGNSYVTKNIFLSRVNSEVYRQREREREREREKVYPRRPLSRQYGRLIDGLCERFAAAAAETTGSGAALRCLRWRHLPPPPSRTAVLRNLDSCSSMAELRQRHSLLVRLGLSHDNHAAARLLRFCALHSSGDPAYALRLLLHLPSPDAFLFNTLLRSSSAATGDHLPIYELMLRSSVSPNDFTFPALLTSITAARSPIAGEQVHAHIFKLGFHHHRFSQNALITMYGSCGRASVARQLFDEMPHRDVVSWTAMAGGYAACAQLDDARVLFDQMPEKNSVSWNTMAAAYLRNGRLREALELVDGMAELDKFTAATVLAAAAEAGAGSRGRRIHARIVGAGVRVDAKLAAAIVDMYCKCGCLEEAMEVFHGLEEKQRGLSCWNAMIGGLAAHGRGAAAMELFQKMEEAAAVAPDRITFLGVLTACAHAGLVDEGRRLFARMQAYAVAPAMEHYGCLVDLYARSGMMAEAEEVIAGMVKAALPDAAVVGALAGACRTHGELELGERWGWRAVELEPHNAGRYVLVANLYARAGRWEAAARVRKLMGERGVEKEPGRSVVEAGGAAAVGSLSPATPPTRIQARSTPRWRR